MPRNVAFRVISQPGIELAETGVARIFLGGSIIGISAQVAVMVDVSVFLFLVLISEFFGFNCGPILTPRGTRGCERLWRSTRRLQRNSSIIHLL